MSDVRRRAGVKDEPPPAEIIGWTYETSWGKPMTFKSLDEIRLLQHALLFAAADMHQVMAACNAHGDAEDVSLLRALETAIVVCYCRAFTESRLRRLNRTFAPAPRTPERELHRILMNLRRQVYAHTDPVGGRTITSHTIEERGEISRVGFTESFHPLDNITEIRSLAADRSRLFQLEATRLGGALTRIVQASGPDAPRTLEP
jgi:hypothetical protein